MQAYFPTYLLLHDLAASIKKISSICLFDLVPMKDVQRRKKVDACGASNQFPRDRTGGFMFASAHSLFFFPVIAVVFSDKLTLSRALSPSGKRCDRLCKFGPVRKERAMCYWGTLLFLAGVSALLLARTPYTLSISLIHSLFALPLF